MNKPYKIQKRTQIFAPQQTKDLLVKHTIGLMFGSQTETPKSKQQSLFTHSNLKPC